MAEPEDGVGLGLATGVEVLPGLALAAGLPAASGAGISVGAAEQVLVSVVTETGFGVGVMLPTGAAVPPVDGAALADEVAAGDAWLGFVAGDWLGLTVVVRLGDGMLL